MHWQEACLKSESKKAKRIHRDGWVIRDWNGSAITQTHDRRHTRDAYHHEVEGYDDWEPY